MFDIKELERIILDNQTKELDVGGRKLVFGKFQEVEPIKNHYNTLVFSELSSLLTMIKKDWGCSCERKLFINIEDHHRVSTFTIIDCELEREEPYKIVFNGNLYPFGKWQDYENFIISLRSLFTDTEERNKLLQFIASVKSVDNNEISDNGVAQVASTKKGTLIERGDIKAIYKLSPYRTFKEIHQVCSEYLFRISKQGNELRFALFEVDGGNWQLAQKDLIRSYFEANLENEIGNGWVVIVS